MALPPLTDDRTPHANLPLPSMDNWQEQDVPRMREALGLLDTILQLMGLELDEKAQQSALEALAEVAAGKLPLAGGTMAGPLVLASEPTADMHPATRKYVDDGAGGRRRLRTVAAADTLKVADRGNIVLCNGTFVLGFDALDALAAGWWCLLSNPSSGDVTLSAPATKQIDGRAGYVIYPRETRLLQCDGETLRSWVLRPFRRRFEFTENFVKPPGYLGFHARFNAGAGSGRAAIGLNNATVGHGGGGGGGYQCWIPDAQVADIELVTVGLGGLAVTAEVTTANTPASALGNAGGNTTFAGLVVYGGTPGSGYVGNGGAAIDAAMFGPSSTSTVKSPYAGGQGGDNANANSRGHMGGGGGGSANASGAMSGGASDLAGRGGNAVRSTNTASEIVAEGGQFPSGGGGGAAIVNASLPVGTKCRSGPGADGFFEIWG